MGIMCFMNKKYTRYCDGLKQLVEDHPRHAIILLLTKCGMHERMQGLHLKHVHALMAVHIRHMVQKHRETPKLCQWFSCYHGESFGLSMMLEKQHIPIQEQD